MSSRRRYRTSLTVPSLIITASLYILVQELLAFLAYLLTILNFSRTKYGLYDYFKHTLFY